MALSSLTRSAFSPTCGMVQFASQFLSKVLKVRVDAPAVRFGGSRVSTSPTARSACGGYVAADAPEAYVLYLRLTAPASLPYLLRCEHRSPDAPQ